MSETLTNWSTLFIHSQEKKRYMEYVASWEEKIHSFLQFDVNKGLALTDDLIRQPGIIETTDEFTGVPFGVKDNIAVRSFKLTCGSNMLKSFVSPYTATAVERLVRRGAIVAGKTNLDEFGMGSSTENSALSRHTIHGTQHALPAGRAAAPLRQWPQDSSPLPWVQIREVRSDNLPLSAAYMDSNRPTARCPVTVW